MTQDSKGLTSKGTTRKASQQKTEKIGGNTGRGASTGKAPATITTGQINRLARTAQGSGNLPPSGKNFTLTTPQLNQNGSGIVADRAPKGSTMSGRERTLANLAAKKEAPKPPVAIKRVPVNEDRAVKPKIRETLLEDMIEYFKRPNGKLIEKFRETCA